MAKELRQSTVDTANYSRKLFAARCAQQGKEGSSKKVPDPNHLVPPTKKKTLLSTLKYTFAGWLRYFYGDFTTKEDPFVLGPPIPQPLRCAAFLTFWLHQYVFIDPSANLISASVCIIASLLTKGRSLSLAFLYLVSLYARLDQIQEQMRTSFGRFVVNCYVDEVFLQYFLFECFPAFGPI